MPLGGGDCLNGVPSPTVPFQRVSQGWRTPPVLRQVGCAPTPSPLRRPLHRTPAAVPETRLRAVTPISGPRACWLRRRRAWARAPERALGPGARTAPGKALTLHRAREALALAARVHRRRLGGPRPAGMPKWGTLIYMVQGLSLLFFHTPHPAFSQLCEAGRTDVKQAALPLPRGRWPGPAPQPGFAAAAPRGSGGRIPRPRPAEPPNAPGELDGHARPGVLGDRRWRGMRPCPHSAFSADAIGLPGSGRLLHLQPQALGPQRGGAAALLPGRLGGLRGDPRAAAVAGWVRGARRAPEKPRLGVSAGQISKALGGSPAPLGRLRGPRRGGVVARRDPCSRSCQLYRASQSPERLVRTHAVGPTLAFLLQ